MGFGHSAWVSGQHAGRFVGWAKVGTNATAPWLLSQAGDLLVYTLVGRLSRQCGIVTSRLEALLLGVWLSTRNVLQRFGGLRNLGLGGSHTKTKRSPGAEARGSWKKQTQQMCFCLTHVFLLVSVLHFAAVILTQIYRSAALNPKAGGCVMPSGSQWPESRLMPTAHPAELWMEAWAAWCPSLEAATRYNASRGHVN